MDKQMTKMVLNNVFIYPSYATVKQNPTYYFIPTLGLQIRLQKHFVNKHLDPNPIHLDRLTG